MPLTKREDSCAECGCTTFELYFHEEVVCSAPLREVLGRSDWGEPAATAEALKHFLHRRYPQHADRLDEWLPAANAALRKTARDLNPEFRVRNGNTYRAIVGAVRAALSDGSACLQPVDDSRSRLETIPELAGAARTLPPAIGFFRRREDGDVWVMLSANTTLAWIRASARRAGGGGTPSWKLFRDEAIEQFGGVDCDRQRVRSMRKPNGMVPQINGVWIKVAEVYGPPVS